MGNLCKICQKLSWKHTAKRLINLITVATHRGLLVTPWQKGFKNENAYNSLYNMHSGFNYYNGHHIWCCIIDEEQLIASLVKPSRIESKTASTPVWKSCKFLKSQDHLLLLYIPHSIQKNIYWLNSNLQ